MMPSSNINNNSGTHGGGPALVKPKRPLSSYNLFYRFKREKIIELGNTSKDAITSMINASPGLEDCYTAPPPNATSNEINTLRKRNIRNDMEHNLSPRETSRRRHRKNTSAINGGMSFIELGKVMNASWQNCDDVAKSVFSELADEGREIYRQKLVKYNTANNKTAEEHHAKIMMKMNAVAEKNKRKREVVEVPIKTTTTTTKIKRNGGGTSPTPSTASSTTASTKMTLETIPSLPLYNHHGNVVVVSPPQSFSPTSSPSYYAQQHQQQQQQQQSYTTPPQSPPYPPEIKRRRFDYHELVSHQQQQHLNQQHQDEQDYILLNSNISKLQDQLALARMKVRFMEMKSDLYKRQRSLEEQQQQQQHAVQQFDMLSSSSSGSCYPFGDMLSSSIGMTRPYHHPHHPGCSPEHQQQFVDSSSNGQTSPATTTMSLIDNQGSVSSTRSLSSSSLSSSSKLFDQQQEQQQQEQNGLSYLATATSMILGNY